MMNGLARSSGCGVIGVLLLACSAIPCPAADWKVAKEPRAFSFPEDHASHEDYRIEWWYYTGNLQTADGRPFGYQLTFFRTGVDRQPRNPSRWAVRDLYTAHFAISDIRRDRFTFFERVSRRGIDEAGADPASLHVWNGDWQVQLDGERHLLSAEQNGTRLQLELVSLKPPVLQGMQGLSPKGPSEGNASYYYSLTPHAHVRHVGRQRGADHGQRRKLDGPRVQHQFPGAGPAGLGLVRHSVGGRLRVD